MSQRLDGWRKLEGGGTGSRCSPSRACCVTGETQDPLGWCLKGGQYLLKGSSQGKIKGKVKQGGGRRKLAEERVLDNKRSGTFMQKGRGETYQKSQEQ